MVLRPLIHQPPVITHVMLVFMWFESLAHHFHQQIIEFLAAKGYEPRDISEKDGGLADPVNPRDMEGMSEDLNVAFIRRNLTSTRPDLFCAVTGDARE